MVFSKAELQSKLINYEIKRNITLFHLFLLGNSSYYH